MYDAAPDLAGLMVNKTADSSSASPDLGQPSADATDAIFSMLNTWGESDVQNFSMEAISDYVVGEPFELSSNLAQEDNILVALPGDISMNISEDASA